VRKSDEEKCKEFFETCEDVAIQKHFNAFGFLYFGAKK